MNIYVYTSLTILIGIFVYLWFRVLDIYGGKKQ